MDETFITLLMALGAFGLYWIALQWFMGGGSMEDEKGLVVWPGGIHLASRRCVKCGIHPDPSQMPAVFGANWEHFTMCTACRERKEILVIMCQKVRGIAPEDIKAWYMPLELREFARKAYQGSSPSTKIYISDGERFWNWVSWPYNLKNFIKWDEFLAACPNWKIIKPEEKMKTYPEHPELTGYTGV